MNEGHLEILTKLEARIRQAVRDLEQHSRILPSTQQGAVEATIKRLKMALEGEEAIADYKGEHF